MDGGCQRNILGFGAACFFYLLQWGRGLLDSPDPKLYIFRKFCDFSGFSVFSELLSVYHELLRYWDTS